MKRCKSSQALIFAVVALVALACQQETDSPVASVKAASLLSRASADATTKLTCGFTEPFYTLEIDLAAKVVSMTAMDDNGDMATTVVATDVEVRTDLSDPFLPKYSVMTSAGASLAELALDMQGSDGMSDIVYPYSIRHNGYFGGCESDKIAALNPSI